MNVAEAKLRAGLFVVGKDPPQLSESARILAAEVDRLEEQLGRMRGAARAFSELNAVYRVHGRRPSEELFKRLERARATMQELGAE